VSIDGLPALDDDLAWRSSRSTLSCPGT